MNPIPKHVVQERLLRVLQNIPTGQLVAESWTSFDKREHCVPVFFAHQDPFDVYVAGARYALRSSGWKLAQGRRTIKVGGISMRIFSAVAVSKS